MNDNFMQLHIKFDTAKLWTVQAVVSYNFRCIYVLFTVIAISVNYLQETESGETGITCEFISLLIYALYFKLQALVCLLRVHLLSGQKYV